MPNIRLDIPDGHVAQGTFSMDFTQKTELKPNGNRRDDDQTDIRFQFTQNGVVLAPAGGLRCFVAVKLENIHANGERQPYIYPEDDGGVGDEECRWHNALMTANGPEHLNGWRPDVDPSRPLLPEAIGEPGANPAAVGFERSEAFPQPREPFYGSSGTGGEPLDQDGVGSYKDGPAPLLTLRERNNGIIGRDYTYQVVIFDTTERTDLDLSADETVQRGFLPGVGAPVATATFHLTFTREDLGPDLDAKYSPVVLHPNINLVVADGLGTPENEYITKSVLSQFDRLARNPWQDHWDHPALAPQAPGAVVMVENNQPGPGPDPDDQNQGDPGDRDLGGPDGRDLAPDSDRQHQNNHAGGQDMPGNQGREHLQGEDEGLDESAFTAGEQHQQGNGNEGVEAVDEAAPSAHMDTREVIKKSQELLEKKRLERASHGVGSSTVQAALLASAPVKPASQASLKPGLGGTTLPAGDSVTKAKQPRVGGR